MYSSLQSVWTAHVFSHVYSFSLPFRALHPRNLQFTMNGIRQVDDNLDVTLSFFPHTIANETNLPITHPEALNVADGKVKSKRVGERSQGQLFLEFWWFCSRLPFTTEFYRWLNAIQNHTARLRSHHSSLPFFQLACTWSPRFTTTAVANTGLAGWPRLRGHLFTFIRKIRSWVLDAGARIFPRLIHHDRVRGLDLDRMASWVQ